MPDISKKELKKRRELLVQAARKRRERLDNISKVESAAMGAMNGITMGWGDEMVAALQALAMPGDYSENYEELVEKQRRPLRDAEAANPSVFSGFDTAASIATAAIPGTQALKVGGLLAKGAGRASMFAGQGALGMAGRAESGEKAKAAAIGAGLGVVGGAATQAVGSAVRGSGSRLLQYMASTGAGKKANEMARKTAIKIAKKQNKPTDNPAMTDLEVQEILGGLRKDVAKESLKDPKLAESLKKAAAFRSDPTVEDIVSAAAAPLTKGVRGLASPSKLFGAIPAAKATANIPRSIFDVGLNTAPFPGVAGVAAGVPAAGGLFSE